ncbi:hypothetical protein [Streptomyces sp. NBC_00091]|uniref:hypothetical protein n=1 Tax=Streptomyces sp. NBC_00091 TaxID=2975648 RepID=UPI0022552D32|nr:hypothetical protein [Streptomyces sp. NBC_00091]MCX5378662.1 hypothetical protein [Streptomyces sp. NBC_00091]
MNRHRHLTLLAAPLLASSVVLAPALAAPAASAALPAAFCELVPGASGGQGGETSYDLRLSGFAPGQSVTIDGPRTNLRTRVDDQGSFDKQDVRYGKYSVSSKGGRIGCATPPREKHDGGSGKQKVQVTKVEVLTLTKSGTVVDCTKPVKAAFDGKITAVGKGDVRYFWTFASSNDRIGEGTVTFALGTTQSHSLLKVVELVSSNGNLVTTFVTLHVPSANMTERSEDVSLTCAPQQ